MMFVTALIVGSAISASGIPVPKDRRPDQIPVSASYLVDLQSLLDLGLKPNLKSTADATELYFRLRSRRPDDPRVEFAFSIVLQQLFHPTEALEHLQAADSQSSLYFPARQAVIRNLIRARKYDEAAEVISELLRSLNADDPQAAEAAEWLGRVVACVIGPVGSRDGRSRFGSLDLHLRQNITAILAVSYERGFADLERDVDDLQASIDLLDAEAQAKSEDIKESVDQNAKQRQAQLNKKQAEVSKAGKKWDEWLADESKRYDESLAEMEKRFNDLDRSATALTANIATIRITMDRTRQGVNTLGISVPVSSGAFGVANIVSVSGNYSGADILAMLDVQLELEQQKLSIVYAGQQEISRRANLVLLDRKKVVQEYQLATGKVVAQAEALKKWDQRAKKQAEDAKKNADKKPASLASLEAKIRSLSTYDPYRFDIARARLLSEYTVAPETSKEQAR